MKAILICPSERSEVELLSRSMPLALVPMMGQGLLEYWLTHLAANGFKEVKLLVDDRIEQVQAVAGDGSRWGLQVEIIAESRELTAAQALLKYQSSQDLSASQSLILTLDHLPGMPQHPLLGSYEQWFAGFKAWIPNALTPERVGVHQLTAGIYIGMHAHVSPDAQLVAPCWIGEKAFVGSRAILGPHTILEEGVFIEAGAEVSSSYVAPYTFVGACSELKESLALGDMLINWKSGSYAQVPDPFVLCALRSPRVRSNPGLFARLNELYARNKEDVQLLWKHLLMNRES